MSISLELLLFLGIIVLGVVSFRQDVRTSRISNVWMLLALGYALVVRLYYILPGIEGLVFRPQSLVNWVVSLVVAVFFWRKKWWGGGDAKLFVCYVALIPSSRYGLVYFSHYFSAFLLLLSTFIPAALWIMWRARRELFLPSAGNVASVPARTRRPWQEDLRVMAGFAALFFATHWLAKSLGAYVPLLGSWVWLFYFIISKGLRRLFRVHPFAVVAVWLLSVVGMLYSAADVWGILKPLGLSFLSAGVFLFLSGQVFSAVDEHLTRVRAQNMAFAGWLFLGALLVWFSRDILFWLNWLRGIFS
ncbi:MAG: prepilin peptidase [Candidatus Omnitrophica bacterium]|nr:prepilin peptidase [Candidatus Omnitrophota bacterium]